MQELSEQEHVRREKLAKLRELGIDPYPAAAFDVSHYATMVNEKFEQGLKVRMAGRLMSRRVQGKPALPSSKMPQAGHSSTSTETYYVRTKTKPSTMMFIKNYLISGIL